MVTRGLRWCLCLLSLVFAGSVPPALAQSPSKLPLAHLAPEERVFFATWNGPIVAVTAWDAAIPPDDKLLASVDRGRHFWERLKPE